MRGIPLKNPSLAPAVANLFSAKAPFFAQTSDIAPAKIPAVDERPLSGLLAILRERKQSFGFGTAIANPLLASQFVTDARTTGTIRNT